MRDIIQELLTKVKDDLTGLDVDSMYDDMLDECYDMSLVGGPFSHMLASKVLEECDPIGYRCGFTDWLDSLSDQYYEVDGNYYDKRELERVKDELIDELEDETSDLQDQLDDMSETDIDAGVDEVVQQQVDELEELIAKLRKYSF